MTLSIQSSKSIMTPPTEAALSTHPVSSSCPAETIEKIISQDAIQQAYKSAPPSLAQKSINPIEKSAEKVQELVHATNSSSEEVSEKTRIATYPHEAESALSEKQSSSLRESLEKVEELIQTLSSPLEKTLEKSDITDIEITNSAAKISTTPKSDELEATDEIEGFEPATLVSSSFQIDPPRLTTGFFEPEPVLEQKKEIPPAAKEVKSSLGFSHDQLLALKEFVIACALHPILETPFGIACPNHPEAQYPYPGEMPTNSIIDKAPFAKLLQRSFSKKYRQEERDFNNNLRHWQAQMKNHLLEVPYLQAQDLTFQGYFALACGDYNQAIQLAQNALIEYPFSVEAVSIQMIAQHQNGNFESIGALEKKYSSMQPKLSLNALGFSILEGLMKDSLSKTYLEVVGKAKDQIESFEGNVPLEKGYLSQMMNAKLKEVCQKNYLTTNPDFLDLLLLYFVDDKFEIDYREQRVKLSEALEGKFTHITNLFVPLQENLTLIQSHDLWDHFEALKALKDDLDHDLFKNKDWIRKMVEELSSPIIIEDTRVLREFMLNAIKIRTSKTLFEMSYQK